MGEDVGETVRRGLRMALVLALVGPTAACGIFSGWGRAPVEEVTVTTAKVEKVMDVVAVPAFRLLLPAPYTAPTSRLFVVRGSVKNVGDEPLAFRPETARLVLPDGSAGAVFDRARAAELIRRTEVVLLDGSAAVLREPTRTRLKIEIIQTLLDGAYLYPGQEVQGHLVADTGVPLRSLEGIVLEVSATRQSDQKVVHDAYRFAERREVSENRGL